MRVVFDTSVLYSAILKPQGIPARAFDYLLRGLLLPCISPAIMAEYREVLLERPTLRPCAERALRVLDALAGVAITVTPTQKLAISSHESDNRFYECADAAQADYIITGNLKHFPKSYKRTRIINARQLLNILQLRTPED
jgi:putative PIN family toxin of toxin-antitoxin system